MYVQKAERKARTKDEVDTVICWFTGYDLSSLKAQLNKGVSVKDFLLKVKQI